MLEKLMVKPLGFFFGIIILRKGQKATYSPTKNVKHGPTCEAEGDPRAELGLRCAALVGSSFRDSQPPSLLKGSWDLVSKVISSL